MLSGLFGAGFQFHKGTIRTEALTPYKEKLMNFNSIKVQLERIYHW